MTTPFASEAVDQALETVRGGDAAGWSTLYRALQPSVAGYLRLRGAVDFEDLVGEVFLQVVRDFPRFRGDAGDFRSWVFTIAHRRLIDQRRRRGRRPEVLTPALDEGSQVGDVEQEAEERLAEQRIRSLIETLSPGQRDVLLLRILGDLSVPEIGGVLGKRPAAIKALQRRGYRTLKDQLQAYPFGADER